MEGVSNYFIPKDMSSDEAAQRKKVILATSAIVLATAVVGAGVLYFNQSACDSSVDSCDIPVKPLDQIAATLSDEFSKKIASLKGTQMGDIFEIFNTTIGVTNENQLVWKDNFCGNGGWTCTGYIDTIYKSNLAKSVMWGFDPENRSYVSMSITCDTVGESLSSGVLNLFARYGGGNWVVRGGRQHCAQMAAPLNPEAEEFYSSLRTLLSGGSLTFFDGLNQKVTLALSK